MKHLQNFNTIQEMLNYEKLCRPCVVSYPTGNPAPNDRAAIFNPVDNPSEIGNPTRVIKSGGTYVFDNTLDLNITSNTTILLRCKYRNINVSNNAVLTISDTFVQALDTITVEAGSQIRVSPTSVLVAGEGGIVTADVNGLYIEADSNGNGSVIFNETVSNNHPLATVAVYNYSVQKDKYYWEQIGSPISTNIKTNNGIRKTYRSSLNEWDIVNGWVWVSMADTGMFPDRCYNYARAEVTTPGLDVEFYGPLRGNEDITFNFTQKGYQAISLNYTASVPTSYILSQLELDSSLWNKVFLIPRKSIEVISDFLEITTSNIDLYPDILMMQGFFVKLSNNSQVTLRVNYNDAVLAYYKQKYNF